MSFWELNQRPQHVAIIDNHEMIDYPNLQKHVDEFKCLISTFNEKKLGVIFCKNTKAAIIAYIGALQLKHPVILLADDIDINLRTNILETYKPDWIWSAGETLFSNYESVSSLYGYKLFISIENSAVLINDELAILLSTSGTTGSPKMVRLTYANLQSNAEAIASYLNINDKERAVTTLPMQYSYGLSVLNSHLLAGASILLTDNGLMSKDFWESFNKYEVTSIAGVPYTYQMLRRLRIDKMKLPSLKKMTQAGGRLDEAVKKYINDHATENGIHFFVMYGQTEATARMSFVPPHRLADKMDSIGIPIPGGKLELDQDGQLIYYGKNVMLGYAESREDLCKGDECNGRLETGDIAYQDGEGFFFITGRKKRFIKLFGLRINLDDVEKTLGNFISDACYCIGNDDKLVVFILQEDKIEAVQKFIKDVYHLHPTSFKVTVIDEIPRLHSGKVDYKALQERSGL